MGKQNRPERWSMLAQHSGRGAGRGGQSGPPRPGDRSSRRERSAPLHPDYLKEGYFDQHGRIRRDVVLDTAKVVAEQIAEDRRVSKKHVGSTALRAFFGHVRAIEARLRAGVPFDELKKDIWRLAKMAAYQRQRSEPPINQTFIDFIERNVALAERDEKHFRAFVEHFESVIAFFPRR